MHDGLGQQSQRSAERPKRAMHGLSLVFLNIVTSETERARSVDIRLSLFSTICGRASNVFMVAIAIAICGLAAFIREEGWFAPTIAAIGFLLFLIRCGTIIVVRRLQASLLPIDPDPWLVRFGLAAIGSSICWGLLTFHAMVMSHDSVLMLITVISNVGSSGAVAARNAGVPRLAKLILLLSLMPIVPGSAYAGENGYLLLVVLVPAMTYGLFIVIREHNDQIVDLFVSRQALFRLSNMDALTGLSNRRHFNERLAKAVARQGLIRAPFAILLLDVDYFKTFNDRYGHPEGDVCLQQIAETFLRNVRDIDLVSRYGGEEFAILLEDADHASASIVACRIRDAVEAMGRPHENRPDGIGTVTISIGIAAMRPGDTEGDGLIKTADDALYAAKRAGRNRIAGFYIAPTSDSAAGGIETPIMMVTN